MANYEATTRTNYFRVKDAEALKALIARTTSDIETVRLWSKECDDDNIRYAFGCYGSISGIKEDDELLDDSYDEDAFERFVQGLQECVVDDDAIVITEVGNEKLCYATAVATIITSTSCETVDLTESAYSKASQMLCDPNWTTMCEY